MQNDRPPPAAAHEKEQNFEGSVACACSPSYPRPCPGRAESRSPSSPLHSMSDTSSFTIPSHIITWAHYLTVFCHTTNLLAYSSLPYLYVPYILSYTALLCGESPFLRRVSSAFNFKNCSASLQLPALKLPNLQNLPKITINCNINRLYSWWRTARILISLVL